MRIANLVASLFISCIVFFGYHFQSEKEKLLKTSGLEVGTRISLIEPLQLPMYTAALLALTLLTGRPYIESFFVDLGLLFLIITIYYAILLLLLPLLRRSISALTCASLWLVPNFLYITLYYRKDFYNPIFTITISEQLFSPIIWIWLLGFFVVIIWQFATHFHYRNFILNNASEFTDEAILSMWHSNSKLHGVKNNIPILISKNVNTPITIGCFNKTMILVLPDQSYSENEFKIIFQHELRHILRADTRTKVFIGFCVAVSWFNPLSWIARKKVAEDLELSCDEAVLFDTDEITRRQYAELLLKNAGSSQGFTTCLSSSANSLHYRLKGVINPTKRHTGTIIIGLAVFCLFMPLGTVSIVGEANTVQSIFYDKISSEITIESIYTNLLDNQTIELRNIGEDNESTLTAYIATLRVKKLYSSFDNYTYVDDDHLSIYYKDVEKKLLLRIVITDKYIILNDYNENHSNTTFILDDIIDWNMIIALLPSISEN